MCEMEMPVPCLNCNEWFDLHDGFGSEKWHPNTTICETCHEKEGQEIERDEEITTWTEQLENAIYDLKEAAHALQKLGIKETPEKIKKALNVLDTIGIKKTES